MLQTTVILEGNVAAGIEVTYTIAGKQVVRFPVLVNRRPKDPTAIGSMESRPVTVAPPSAPSVNTSPTAWARATESSASAPSRPIPGPTRTPARSSGDRPTQLPLTSL
jgi:hypothetical protein